jgi:hypothetical protein
VADLPEMGPANKGAALLIAVLALVFTLTEVAGDDAKTTAQMKNVESANLWAFFQARTIRQTILNGMTERARVDLADYDDLPEVKAELGRLMTRWQAAVARWESEPETREGRRELLERARQAEAERDQAIEEDGWYDTAGALLQGGIVMASVAIISGLMIFAWVAGAVGLIGAAVSAATYFGLL